MGGFVAAVADPDGRLAHGLLLLLGGGSNGHLGEGELERDLGTAGKRE